MIVEIAVLGGGEGLRHQLGNEGGGHEDAPLARIFAQHRAVAGIDAGGDGRAVVLQRLDAGQVARDRIDVEDARQHAQRGQGGDAKTGIDKKAAEHRILLKRLYSPFRRFIYRTPFGVEKRRQPVHSGPLRPGSRRQPAAKLRSTASAMASRHAARQCVGVHLGGVD